MINSGLIIDFNRVGEDYILGNIHKYNERGVSQNISPTDFNNSFEFPFYNLVYNAPNRVIITNESYTKLGTEGYLNYGVLNTWLTLARVYKATLGTDYAPSENRISYRQFYTNKVYYIIKNDTVGYLYINSIFTDDTQFSAGDFYLIYFPLVFVPAKIAFVDNGLQKQDFGWYVVDPSLSLCMAMSSMFGIDQDNPLMETDDTKIYELNFSRLSYPQEKIPIYRMYKGGFIPNIDPDKFNLDRW